MKLQGKITRPSEMVDTLPYKTFKKLKGKYPAKMVLITSEGMAMPGIRLAYKDHREYIAAQFKKEGIEITRWQHDYESLSTADPRLGLVYLANDSALIAGMEVWCLIGHNAKHVTG